MVSRQFGLGGARALWRLSHLLRTQLRQPYGRGVAPMPYSFPSHGQSASMVGRTPWSAADAPVGLLAPCKMMIVVPDAGRGRPGPEGTPTRGSAPPLPPDLHSGKNYVALGS